MRVLIGCETSGVVRRSFDALGHDAWSCDLLPAEDGSNRHIVCDVRELLNENWDLLAVMHPPCTRLCNSGVRWLTDPPRHAPADANEAEKLAWPSMGREAQIAIMWRLLDEGCDLFSACWNAPIARLAIENPVMHGHAKTRIRNYSPPAQTVQPWWFGEPFFKATSFYLRELKPLVATAKLSPPASGTEEHKRWSRVHRHSGWGAHGKSRSAARSRTFKGMADAMALQWGGRAA